MLLVASSIYNSCVKLLNVFREERKANYLFPDKSQNN